MENETFMSLLVGLFIGFAFTLGLMTFVPSDMKGEHVLGQMICDQQYGEGMSTYSTMDINEKTVTCRLAPKQSFDGGHTKLITGGDRQ